MRGVARCVVGALGLVASIGLAAQQPVVAGKWEVKVDGQSARTAELVVQGTKVTGTITAWNSPEKLKVAGEFKKMSLTFSTPGDEESFGVVVREGEPVQGTYVYCTAGVCTKSGVTLQRPASKRAANPRPN